MFCAVIWHNDDILKTRHDGTRMFQPGQLGGQRRRILRARRCAKGRKLQKVTKEVIRVLLTRSLFGGSMPRRLLLRLLPVKSTSAPVRF
jgi:hypothetical protein